jgi:putative PIN family toxin of toxin-antitoxin system
MKVVFDTNVVASASFWRGKPFDCLVAWSQGRCDGFTSPALLAEYQETIEELRVEYSERRPVEWAEALADCASLVFPNDPDDEMVLECSIAAEADCIVSGDKKHLLALGEFRNIPIISPAAFLPLLKGP